MEAMEAILSRRSIRKYTADPIPEELINDLLKAAMSAPSASNERLWHFIVIDDHGILDKIPEFHPHSSMLKYAPLAIAVCADLELEINRGCWALDCSAATQNILIAAQAKGLGAVWLGIYPSEERITGMRKLLGLPQQVIPLSVVSIGYPAEEKSPKDRYDASRVHHNSWQ